MMLHGCKLLRPWIASVWLTAGCNIDTLWSEFYLVEPTTGESSTGSTSSADTSGSDSGSSSTSSTTSTTHDADTIGTPGTSTTGTSTSTGDASSTGQPPAVCGNGIVEPGEECDDGNASDADACTTTTCLRPRLIFVLSELLHGSDIGGLDGGDTRCRLAAGKANIPDYLNFKALLSDSTTHAKDRLFPSKGPYRLINGLQVARDFDALMNETLEHPVDTTELGTAPPSAGVWTGTQQGGTAVLGDVNCMDWHGSFLDYGVFGKPLAVDASWLNYDNPVINPTDCSTMLPLYCLEQE